MQRPTLTSPGSRSAPLNGRAPAEAAERRHLRNAAADFPIEERVRWGWACRGLDPGGSYTLLRDAGEAPRAGDAALVRVRSINNHTRLTQADCMRLRLYPGVVYMGVFGNRYATSAIEAEVMGTDALHQLTGAGMIGTFRSREKSSKGPTKLDFLGYVADKDGQRINLKEKLFRLRRLDGPGPAVVLVVGTGMNSGKTTTAAKLVWGLLGRGLRVAACKLTGSVSRRDYFELSATGAFDVRDFSDYGFPSTYLCDEDELIDLFHTMVADAAEARPDVLVMEIADGVLQRETQMLLRNEVVRAQTCGVVLAAACAPSALLAAGEIAQHGHAVTAVSGLITNSPLFMREFAARSRVPLGSSADDGAELAALVAERLRASELGFVGAVAPCGAD